MRKIRVVVDCRVRSERHVEFAALVEATKTVEARAVQVIKQLGSLCALRTAVLDEFVEARAVPVEEWFVVTHLDTQRQAVLKMTIEVYEVWIDVV